MATLTAQRVKLYKETLAFIKRYVTSDPRLFKIPLLNEIRTTHRRDYFGVPLFVYAWVIFKSSPQFATSHGFKLLTALRDGNFEEFAKVLDDLFTKFWQSTKDRENLEGEIKKLDVGEIEHPNFISDEEHQELGQIENLTDVPQKQQVLENFAQSRIEQLYAPQVPPTITPPPSPVGEVKTTSLPKRGFSFSSFKLPKIPEGITTPTKRFIKGIATPRNIATIFTGGLGSIVGYGITKTLLGIVLGGASGIALKTAIEQKGAGQFFLSGITKTGNSVATFITGLSGGGGGKVSGGLIRGTVEKAGGKVAVAGFLLFFLLAALLISGFAPPGTPGTPGGGAPSATGSGTLTPIPGGGNCPDQTIINANKVSPNTCRYFGLGVDLFNTNISQAIIDIYINKYSSIFISAGKGNLNEFTTRVNYMVTKSREVGINPILALGYWKTESNFSTVGSRDLGCSPEAIDFYEQVDCKLGINDFSNPSKNPITNCARSKDAESVACRTLKSIRTNNGLDINNPMKYPISTFDDFAEAYGSRDPGLDGPGKVNNNCVNTYNMLVEVAKELNACVVSTPTPNPINPPIGTSDKVVSCPLSQDGTGSFRFICGTFNNPRGGGPCGHGNPLYYVACTQPPYAACPFTEQLRAAVDARPFSGNGSNSIVYLPFLYGNQPVKWTKVKGPEPISGGADGYKVEYEADFAGKRIRIDLTHINGTINSAAQNSGDVVSTLKAGVDKDGGGHLHTAVSVDGKWVDAINEAKLCTP